MEFASNDMKYKPLKRKRHKSRPIRDLMPHSKHILVSLLEGSNNVNGLFRKLQQTGFTYKRDVLDSIGYLEQGQLIIKNNSPQHSMKIITSLTNLGKNIAVLIVNVEKYTRSLSRLHEAALHNFDISFLNDLTNVDELRKGICEERKLPTVLSKVDRVLKNKGWSEDERMRFAYDKFTIPQGIAYILEQSPKDIFNILLYKYQLLLLLNANEIAKAVIQDIIIDLITQILQYVDVKRLQETSQTDGILDHISELVLDHTVVVSSMGGLMYQFMNKYVMEVFDSMFSVVEPRSEFIKRRIDTQIKWTKNRVSTKYDETWEDAEIYMDQSISRVIPFYEKISEK
jgi:DNA-binding HxlR family transcriptional regulator